VTPHRYSVSKGIPRLRKAICTWYKRRYGVTLNAEKEAIVTIGSKEGLSHLAAPPSTGDAGAGADPAIDTHFTASSSPAPTFATCHWCRVAISLPSWKGIRMLAEAENLVLISPAPDGACVELIS